MRNQVGLDRDTFEYLRRLRMRVGAARSAQAAKARVPSEKWLSRSDPKEDPVTFTRQTCNLLKRIGYNVTYEELPDWGHAFPYSINERMVLPWFESLPPKQSA